MRKEDYRLTAEEVITEVVRAKSIHIDDFHNQHEGYAVLLEEVDELWDEVKKNQRNYDLNAQRKEAVQVAAMAIRFATEVTKQPEAKVVRLSGVKLLNKTDEIWIRGTLEWANFAYGVEYGSTILRQVSMIDLNKEVASYDGITYKFV